MFKVTDQIPRKWKTTFYKPVQYWINKIFVQNPVFKLLNISMLKWM